MNLIEISFHLLFNLIVIMYEIYISIFIIVC